MDDDFRPAGILLLISHACILLLIRTETVLSMDDDFFSFFAFRAPTTRAPPGLAGDATQTRQKFSKANIRVHVRCKVMGYTLTFQKFYQANRGKYGADYSGKKQADGKGLSKSSV